MIDENCSVAELKLKERNENTAAENKRINS